MSRAANRMRPVTIEPFPSAAAGSVVIAQGATRVLCTASIESAVPPWMIDRETGAARQGWVTAEYAMLPGSTPRRKSRGVDSRATEIKRLIGRALRASVDLARMPGLTITCDCDVLVADGGTRTASVTGAWVALARALAVARSEGMIEHDPLLGPVAAVSVGLVEGACRLDLDYPLDSRADVDMNVAMNHLGELVELQATGEGGTLPRATLDELLDLAAGGITKLMAIQRRAVKA